MFSENIDGNKRILSKKEFLEMSKAEREALTELDVGLLFGNFSQFNSTEIQQIATAISECKNLTAISFAAAGLELTPEDMEVLLSPLPKLPTLKKINLSANSVTCMCAPCDVSDESFAKLCSIVANCRSLEELDFSANSLGKRNADGFRAFSEILANCPKLRIVNLNYNQLSQMDEEKTMLLADGIASSKHLASIDLGDTCITPDMWPNHLSKLNPELLKRFLAKIAENPNLDQVITSGLSSEVQSNLNDVLLKNRFKVAIQEFEKPNREPIPKELQLQILHRAFPEQSTEKLKKLYGDSYDELFFPGDSNTSSAPRNKS